MSHVNAIYITVFESPVIIEQSKLLLRSLSRNVANADIIFRTSEDIKPDIENYCNTLGLDVTFWISDVW